MNYEAKDLPYNQLEQIGMAKRDVLGMPPEDLKALLSGRTTSLQSIKIKDQDVERSMGVKLSVQPHADGSLNLMIHPIRKVIQNDDQLSDAQLTELQKGELVVAPKISLNGEKELHLFQLDRETNEIIKTRLNSISAPRYLMDIELTPENKSILLQGKTIDLEDRHGNIHKMSIDLIDPKGYTIKKQDQKEQVSISQTHEEESLAKKGIKR